MKRRCRDVEFQTSFRLLIASKGNRVSSKHDPKEVTRRSKRPFSASFLRTGSNQARKTGDIRFAGPTLGLPSTPPLISLLRLLLNFRLSSAKRRQDKAEDSRLSWRTTVVAQKKDLYGEKKESEGSLKKGRVS